MREDLVKKLQAARSAMDAARQRAAAAGDQRSRAAAMAEWGRAQKFGASVAAMIRNGDAWAAAQNGGKGTDEGEPRGYSDRPKIFKELAEATGNVIGKWLMDKDEDEDGRADCYDKKGGDGRAGGKAPWADGKQPNVNPDGTPAPGSFGPLEFGIPGAPDAGVDYIPFGREGGCSTPVHPAINPGGYMGPMDFTLWDPNEEHPGVDYIPPAYREMHPVRQGQLYSKPGLIPGDIVQDMAPITPAGGFAPGAAMGPINLDAAQEYVPAREWAGGTMPAADKKAEILFGLAEKGLIAPDELEWMMNDPEASIWGRGDPARMWPGTFNYVQLNDGTWVEEDPATGVQTPLPGIQPSKNSPFGRQVDKGELQDVLDELMGDVEAENDTGPGSSAWGRQEFDQVNEAGRWYNVYYDKASGSWLKDSPEGPVPATAADMSSAWGRQGPWDNPMMPTAGYDINGDAAPVAPPGGYPPGAVMGPVYHNKSGPILEYNPGAWGRDDRQVEEGDMDPEKMLPEQYPGAYNPFGREDEAIKMFGPDDMLPPAVKKLFGGGWSEDDEFTGAPKAHDMDNPDGKRFDPDLFNPPPHPSGMPDWYVNKHPDHFPADLDVYDGPGYSKAADAPRASRAPSAVNGAAGAPMSRAAKRPAGAFEDHNGNWWLDDAATGALIPIDNPYAAEQMMGAPGRARGRAGSYEDSLSASSRDAVEPRWFLTYDASGKEVLMNGMTGETKPLPAWMIQNIKDGRGILDVVEFHNEDGTISYFNMKTKKWVTKPAPAFDVKAWHDEAWRGEKLSGFAPEGEPLKGTLVPPEGESEAEIWKQIMEFYKSKGRGHSKAAGALRASRPPSAANGVAGLGAHIFTQE